MHDLPDRTLNAFCGLRDSLQATRSGHGGREVCEALTTSLDRAVAGLVSPVPERTAIVAIGGYGRRELSLYSDVDLMLLHGLADPGEQAAALFRPLWDAKLRVGHSVRTVKEAIAAAKERFDTHTTLLTSRLVAGDEALYAEYLEGIASVTRARPLRRHLVADERERRANTPYLVMATDVKQGRGGLRTLHGFAWERRREELIGRFSSDSRPDENQASESLLQVRNALHAVAGRAHDVFSVDLREPVARWLGRGVDETAGMLVEAMHVVDRLAARRWPEVSEQRPRGWVDRIAGKPGPLTAVRKPTLAEFLWLLETGDSGREGFQRLWESGSLDDLLPEWEVVRSLPQLASFHDHPVAAHLWRTVDEMQALIEDGSHYGRVATELDATDVLLLASFLHDIGKGHGGDHATVGAEIAGAFCERIGVDPERRRLIAEAVRLHLLLPTAATRRDLDAPAVIEEVAETVGDLQLLQVLYLLAVADSKATGPAMWNPWKETLLRTLFLRCAAVFGADRAADFSGTSTVEVMNTAGPERRAEATSHLSEMPEEYLRSVSAHDVLWHLDLIAGMEGESAIGVRSGSAADSVVVVGRRQPLFRRRVAEVFAANGVDVLEARLFGRSDGIIVDTFRVRSDRTAGRVEPEKWASVRRDIEAGLLGELDTTSKVAARAAAYDGVVGDKPVVTGSLDPGSGEMMLTIKCADRIGRLAEIVGVLNDCDLNIKLAKLDSRAGEVVDTFWVDIVPGGTGEIEALEHRIASAITP